MDSLISQLEPIIIFQSIISAQLFGFACFNVLMLFVNSSFVKRLDSVVIVLTILVGALSLLLEIYTFTKPYFSQIDDRLRHNSGASVSFLGFIVLKMAIVSLVSQSLWFNYIRNAKWIRFVASLLIFFLLFFQQIITLITSLNQDYLPSEWETSQSLLATYLQLLIGFIAITAIGYLLRVYKLIDKN